MSIMEQVENKLSANTLLEEHDKIAIYNIINDFVNSKQGISFDNLLLKLESLTIGGKKDISQIIPIDYEPITNVIHIDNSKMDEISKKYYLAVYMVYINLGKQITQWSTIQENKGLYIGISSLAAKLAVGNENGVEDYFDEEVIVNLLSSIIGTDYFFRLAKGGNFFNIVSELVNIKDKDGNSLFSFSLIDDLLRKINYNFHVRQHKKDYKSHLAEIQKDLTNMFFQIPNLTDEQINNFSLNLVYNPLFVTDQTKYPDLVSVGKNFTEQSISYKDKNDQKAR